MKKKKKKKAGVSLLGPLQPARPLGRAGPGTRGGGCCPLGETEVSVGDMASRTKLASLRAAPPNPPVHSGGGAGAAGVKTFLGCTPAPVLEVTEHSRKDRAHPQPSPWLQTVPRNRIHQHSHERHLRWEREDRFVPGFSII